MTLPVRVSVSTFDEVRQALQQLSQQGLTEEQIQDLVGSMLASSTSITLSYDDAAGTFTAQRAALTGDVTASANGNATTIANDAVTNAKAANMAEATIKGRATGAGTGDPTDLTPAQATAILNAFTGDSGSGGVKGLVPAPASGDAAAGKFLKASGSWEAAGLTWERKTGDFSVGASDVGKVFYLDAVNINVSFASVATLGATFFCYIYKPNLGTLTMTGSGGQSINGASSMVVEGARTSFLVQSSGDATYGLQVLSKSWQTNTTAGQIPISSSNAEMLPKAVSGYGTLASDGTLTVTKVLGVTDGSSATAGDVGEHQQSRVTSLTNLPVATGNWGNLTSLSLTAGDWDVTGLSVFDANGATVTAVVLAVSVNSGSTTTDHQVGDNQITTFPATSTYDSTAIVPHYRLSLSGTTTVYLKSFVNYSAATPRYRCRLSARRVR